MTTPLELLRVWCDGLLTHQITSGADAGGLFCASHGFVHGRCGDAVYPLLSLFRRTGEERYRRAARAVFAWSETHVSRPDGSWRNEAAGRNDWQGITCFSLISLGEVLRHHPGTLTPEETRIWQERIRRGADFLHGYMMLETGDINYVFSSAAALAVAGSLLGEKRHLARARELAHFARRHFTTNYLIWGEGQRGPDDLTPRGLRPIDVPYNVEESIPNLAVYAEITGDTEALDDAVKSLGAHLAWMLPDGAWDAGWCSRLAKWTYWGSRTSDGCAGGCALLQKHDPRFAEAAWRNLRLMADCTHDGLLFCGPHLRARGVPVCTHPTFAHARGLAVALDAGLPEMSPNISLPCDAADGIREWPEAGVVQIALGPWRASITVNDLPHTAKRGGHPSGGSLSLLWHQLTGPLAVASMNEYVRYEGSNMDEAASESDRFVLTPRLEARRGDRLYSNLFDGHAHVTHSRRGETIEVIARGNLRDMAGCALPGDSAGFEMRYRFQRQVFQITVRATAPAMSFHFPVISTVGEPWDRPDPYTFRVRKGGATVDVRTETNAFVEEAIDRVFNYVPGFSALPLSLDVCGESRVSVRVQE